MLSKSDFTPKGQEHIAKAAELLADATDLLGMAFDDLEDRDKATLGMREVVEPIGSYEAMLRRAGFTR